LTGWLTMRILNLVLVLPLFFSASVSAERFDWQRFDVAGRPAFVILPDAEKRREPQPWIMYAPTFDRQLPNEAHEGWMIDHFLKAGIAIAGVDVGESHGSPAGRATFSALYQHLVAGDLGFSPKACLLARSRGGLMLYNWAAENAEKVKCIAGIYPVCDLRTYPGLAAASKAYGMTDAEFAAVLPQHNPVDRLTALAMAKVPIFHIHGDVDKVVPFKDNTGNVALRYRKLGGQMDIVVAPAQGHNMWHGFFHSEELVDFVVLNATGQPRTVSIPAPIAQWKLDEPDGDLAQDAVGDHHGKVIGAKPTAGRIGGARLFDRSKGNHIAIEYSKDFELSTFTVSAWVKLTRAPTFSGIVGTRFGGEYTFDMKVNAAKVHGDIGDGDQWVETSVNFYADDTGSNGHGGELALDRWYHIVYVVDNDSQQCQLFLDADLKKRIAFKGTPKLMIAGRQLHIGHSSSDEFMDGIIDDVCIWGSALSTAQVRKLYLKR
jgi:pimeloyl-ACP methyl ester carboxylesterase